MLHVARFENSCEPSSHLEKYQNGQSSLMDNSIILLFTL